MPKGFLLAVPFVAALAVTLLSNPGLAQAGLWDDIRSQGTAAREGAGFAPADTETAVSSVAIRIINASLTLLGAVFVAFMVYAGYLWMTAGGDGDQLDKAKGVLKTAIIGLVIVLIAYAASAFIVNALVKATTAR